MEQGEGGREENGRGDVMIGIPHTCAAHRHLHFVWSAARCPCMKDSDISLESTRSVMARTDLIGRSTYIRMVYPQPACPTMVTAWSTQN